MSTNNEVSTLLDAAQDFADKFSTCNKVRVGSVIKILSKYGVSYVYGSNHGINHCRDCGCRRIKLYGDASKEHRLPSDCDAIHSEVDAITHAANIGLPLDRAAIFVTRYPCENCARAICESGIKYVFYGRKEDISDYTKEIFDYYNVKVEKVDWEREDNNE